MKHPSQLVFVIPDPTAFPSGGNLYNTNLIAALKAIGLKSQVIDFKEFKNKIKKDSINSNLCGSQKSETAFDNAGQERSRRAKIVNKKHSLSPVYFIDSLYMAELADWLKCNILVEKIYLLIHHLKSLELLGAEQADYFRTKELPILKKLSGCLVTSFYTRQYLEQYNYIPEKIFVIPPAFEQENIQARTNIVIQKSVHAILVANLIERKGVLAFLLALKKLKKLPQHLKIKIIGSTLLEPDYASKCQQTIHELKTTVSFLGEQSHQATLLHLSQSNLFISCASMETFGMALQEAVGFGIPILAVKGGNVATHISSGENGFLFDTPASLVHFLIRLCDESVLLDNLQIAAKRKMQKEIYTWKLAAEQLKINLDLS